MYPGLGCALGSGLGVPVCGGCIGGGLWLIRMEIVFPKLEREPRVGAAPIFPDTECCGELWGLPLQERGLGGVCRACLGFLLPLKKTLVSKCHAVPPRPPLPTHRGKQKDLALGQTPS